MPQDVSFIDTQAYILYLQGNYTRVLNLVQAIPYEVFEANPEIAYHAGLIYAAAGQPDVAREYLQLAANGGWKDAQKVLKQL